MLSHKFFDNKIIIVTGAMGFIGSAVIKYLNDQGKSNILLVDDFNSSDKWKNLLCKSFIDIISKEKIFDFLKDRKDDIKSIIHLGACSDTVEKDGNYFYENNYRFSQKLCEYALLYNIRFIYASSAATYGDGREGFVDDVDALNTLKPLNIYGFSKHIFDLWCKRENIFNKVVGLKYFNVFGPNEYHKKRMSSMVLKMTYQIQKDNCVYLYKSNTEEFMPGDQKRDFIYIKDAVKMTCNFLEGNATGIYNIARGVAVSWNDLAKAIFKALKKDVKINYIDMPKDLFSQYQNYTCADMQKYCKIFNVDGKIPNTTGMFEAVEDYVQNYILKNEVW